MSHYQTQNQSLYLQWYRRGVQLTVDISLLSSRQPQQSPIDLRQEMVPEIDRRYVESMTRRIAKKMEKADTSHFTLSDSTWSRDISFLKKSTVLVERLFLVTISHIY